MIFTFVEPEVIFLLVFLRKIVLSAGYRLLVGPWLWWAESGRWGHQMVHHHLWHEEMVNDGYYMVTICLWYGYWWLMMVNNNLVAGWPTPLKNMMEWVRHLGFYLGWWDSQLIWKVIIKNVPKHQADPAGIQHEEGTLTPMKVCSRK